MARSVRLDERAFNRGVDEVLRLKPLVRAMKGMVSSGKATTVSRETKSGKFIVVEDSPVKASTRRDRKAS